ncbi:copper resistance protein B [Thermomonas carbonis]|uniref:Copper resistance protein B n=1 Tax=Thermomonas carbonis TaxID=1463158 RepID=A0A7G9SP41_9GAMM|nr:copper resistance protein B [Thermomonas carbonis]QNN69616.1 copper resistance protein B [Thermomonas carbonis]GHB94329.1 copper resistance protein B [Thermomonas carbonis]
MRGALAIGLLLCMQSAFAQDHSQHAMPPSSPTTTDEHAQHREHTTGDDAPGDYRSPVLTDADRAAAFPDLHGHDMSAHMDDDPFVWMVMADRFEWQQGDAVAWEGTAWFGHDRGRLWLRSEGERERNHGTEANIEALWGEPVNAWWDVLAGVRHDISNERLGHHGQDWLAIGVQGLAPYKFEVQATVYIGEGGQSMLQAEVEYELLLTNKLILQPRIEATALGRNDAVRGIGSGLGEVDAGLRLRYEVRREVAPYIGIERAVRFGKTADFARAPGDDAHETRWVAGVRFWF